MSKNKKMTKKDMDRIIRTTKDDKFKKRVIKKKNSNQLKLTDMKNSKKSKDELNNYSNQLNPNNNAYWQSRAHRIKLEE